MAKTVPSTWESFTNTASVGSGCNHRAGVRRSRTLSFMGT